MKKIGTLKTTHTPQQKVYDLNDFQAGINDAGQYIVNLSNDKKVNYVIDKICDHAGGRLLVKDKVAVCPMHGWQLDLDTLQYNNSFECKARKTFEVTDSKKLIISDPDTALSNPYIDEATGLVTFRWLNHACIYIECNGVSLITDPWLMGHAFQTGWWLSQPSPQESLELLKQADYVYISHNHPDHLHAETLEHLPKDKLIFTADFESKSSEKLLHHLSFTNVHALSFLDIYELGDKFHISILDSGDFRDDSGLYISANGHEILLTVDSNFLNSNILPKNIDLLLTSFAGGASGFPLCYENYDQEEKNSILDRNREGIKSLVLKYIRETKPKYYMPYAGMFTEISERDHYIKEYNVKNTLDDYEELLLRLSTQYIKPLAETIYELGTSLKTYDIEYVPLEEKPPAVYIAEFKESYPYDTDYILRYLQKSGYQSKQILQIIPTDDTFKIVANEIIYADFESNIFKVIDEQDLIQKEIKGYRVMQLRIRSEALMYIVRSHLPWEDFSIGFQMRVQRFPNEYESAFWYHFTNNYIG